MSPFTRSQRLLSPASRLQTLADLAGLLEGLPPDGLTGHKERVNRGASVRASLGCELTVLRPSWLVRKASGRTTRLGVRITPQRERHPVVATDQMTEEVATAGAR
jgi:hypothetical protein